MKLRHNRIMTDALREIRHTRSRFLSLLVLSALSVCFLAGLRATAPDMKNSADLYFDQQRLMDLRITSTLGLTEEDAAALERQEGVLAVERAYTVDAMVHLTDDDYIVKVLSFTENPGLNAPKLVEGCLPQTAGECLVEPLLLEETGLSLGDAIALDTGSGSYEDALALEKFTIVGTANSPLYIGVDRGTSSLGTGQLPQGSLSAHVVTRPVAGSQQPMRVGWIKAAHSLLSPEMEEYVQFLRQALAGLG